MGIYIGMFTIRQFYYKIIWASPLSITWVSVFTHTKRHHPGRMTSYLGIYPKLKKVSSARCYLKKYVKSYLRAWIVIPSVGR